MPTISGVDQHGNKKTSFAIPGRNIIKKSMQNVINCIQSFKF